MQFVWFYIPAPDDGLELKLSMRSVRKNFVGDVRFTVIGEKPKWYRGHHIPVARVARVRGERVERLPFQDTKNKIMIAASHPEVDEEFVHIMDDVYFLRPTTIEDLKQPRFDPWYRQNRRREWHRWIAATFSSLKSKGYSALQYGTHLPSVFEKMKLQEMFIEFDFEKATILFEIAYSNRYRDNAIPYNAAAFLVRLQRPETVGQLDKRAAEACVLNYVSSCWNKTMKGWLLHRYSEPTECEG